MAERVQQVKGPGARPPRGVKPQVKNKTTKAEVTEALNEANEAIAA